MALSTRKPYTDIQTQAWFDAWLPAKAIPYTRLARFDRPIGAWLLFIPGLWSLCLSALSPATQPPFSAVVELILLFFVGAITMRAAGCVVNDLWDQDLDRQVARTAGRPLASGALTRREAAIFLVVLLAIAFTVVMYMPPTVLGLAMISLVFVAIYPLAKRFTYWPQAMLGLTFNFGALMGAAAVTNTIPVWSMLLYAGCFFWIIGYDTIYAHQDREDDLSIGIKSTALLFGDKTRAAVRALYFAAALFWACAFYLAQVGFIGWIGLVAGVGTLMWQVRTLDIHDAEKCLALFKFSAWTGWTIGGGLILDWLVPLMI